MRVVKEVVRQIQRLNVWLRGLRRPCYQSVYIEGDLPNQLKSKTLYIVREDGFLWHASMLCPCNCGKTLHLNLIPDEFPCWRILENQDGIISLYPSILRKKGCKSHFWFRHNTIYWCPEISNIG